MAMRGRRQGQGESGQLDFDGMARVSWERECRKFGGLGKTRMDIATWRLQIDELDRKLVQLLNQRAEAAREIGRLKRNSDLPIYEPEREQAVFANAERASQGPLSETDLARIFERIMDVMRKIQKDEIVAKPGKTKASGRRVPV